MGPDGEQTNTEQPGKVVDGPFAFDGPNHWTITIKDDPVDPSYLERGLGRRTDALHLPTLEQIQISMLISAYDSAPWKFSSRGFRRVVEINFHNLVHRWVNGTMVTMASPKRSSTLVAPCQYRSSMGNLATLESFSMLVFTG